MPSLLERTIAELDKLHAELEQFTGQGEPFYDDLFSRVGCIIAIAKGEYDPETELPMHSMTITLPAHWAPALLNGDESGMSTAEMLDLRRTLDPVLDKRWSIVSLVEGSERFTRYYRVYAPFAEAAAGRVADYVALRPREPMDQRPN